MEIFVNAMDCLTIFSCVLRTCGPHFNLVSICRPNTLMSVFGFNFGASNIDGCSHVESFGISGQVYEFVLRRSEYGPMPGSPRLTLSVYCL